MSQITIDTLYAKVLEAQAACDKRPNSRTLVEHRRDASKVYYIALTYGLEAAMRYKLTDGSYDPTRKPRRNRKTGRTV